MDIKPRSVRCPLCHVQMVHAFDEKRGVLVLACHVDRIAIAADDPMIGRWEEALEKTEENFDCPLCDTRMRFFCTSTGYMKAKCPKPGCGTTVSNPVAPEKGIEPSTITKKQATRKPSDGNR